MCQPDNKPVANHPATDQPVACEQVNRQGVVVPEIDQPAGTPEGLRAFLLTLAYDGSNYCGWQLQVDDVTVQQVVEEAVAQTLGVPAIRVHASSRTDAGVHAVGQAAVFRTNAWKAAAERLPFALNTKLPPDVVVRTAREVPISFHPLRDSVGKRYRYQVFSSRINDPISARQHWWVRRKAAVQSMQAAADYLVGRHDFASFQSTGSPRSSTIRTVRSLTVSETEQMDGKLISIDIEADGFLYNMVRNIVGTLVQVGVGRERPEWVQRVLAARDRTVAGAAAPPQGLVLLEVMFDAARLRQDVQKAEQVGQTAEQGAQTSVPSQKDGGV